MKKILLATSALVAFAGAAAAEVTVSGSARMGLVYDGNDTEFSSRIRVVFKMAGETDGGLAFGASVRADQAGVANSGGTAMSAGTVFISGAFGKLTFGDNDSAANVLVGHVSGVGFTGLGDYNELGYLGNTDTSALYEYSTGALSFALSAGQTTATVVTPTGVIDEQAVAVAAKYSTDTFSVALGYEQFGDDEQVTLGGSATFSGATVKAVVADRDSWADTHYALSVDYAIDATTITAFYTDQGPIDTYGIGAAYDLGGGASVLGGIVDDGFDTIAEVGLTFSF
ncbi:porin [Fertoebacter nigrum]|uniref:Porin n=1 Tax=Fertoeibacter niger TaxID=2656921 RepID=A0A8X8KMG4_9RHOB|nr:porin [Fertoeibacter niger]NUB46354.1 porin [Fertoeibacter niger]